MSRRIIFEEYDNIYKFMDTIGKRSDNGKFDGSSSNTGDKSFYGTSSYSEAEEKFANGLPEETAELKKELLEFKAKSNIETSKIRPHNYYYGYTPNVPAAIIGLPKSMRRIHKTPQKVKAVSIYYDCGANASTSSETLRNCGRAVLKLVYAMELRGYRVKLAISARASGVESEVMLVNIKVKDWKQPLDLLKLSFPLTNASMYRRFGFKCAETMPDVRGSGWHGYGRHLTKDEIIETLDKSGIDTKNTFVIVPDDCQKVDYDPMTLAKEIGIII